MHGGRIGFFQGDIRLLMDDLTTLRPTVFPVVPRLLNRMFDKVRNTDSPNYVSCNALLPATALVLTTVVALF